MGAVLKMFAVLLGLPVLYLTLQTVAGYMVVTMFTHLFVDEDWGSKIITIILKGLVAVMFYRWGDGFLDTHIQLLQHMWKEMHK